MTTSEHAEQVAQSITFVVYGRPCTKQRLLPGHRLPERVKAWESAIGYEARDAMNVANFEKITGPVACELIVILPDRRKRDIDNLSKVILDGCNGILWDDDTQIVDLHILKKLDREHPPGVIIKAWEIETEGEE